MVVWEGDHSVQVGGVGGDHLYRWVVWEVTILYRRVVWEGDHSVQVGSVGG